MQWNIGLKTFKTKRMISTKSITKTLQSLRHNSIVKELGASKLGDAKTLGR